MQPKGNKRDADFTRMLANNLFITAERRPLKGKAKTSLCYGKQLRFQVLCHIYFPVMYSGKMRASDIFPIYRGFLSEITSTKIAGGLVVI